MALDELFMTILTIINDRKQTKTRIIKYKVRVIHAKEHDCLIMIDFIPFEFCLVDKLNVRKIKVGYAVICYSVPSTLLGSRWLRLLRLQVP